MTLERERIKVREGHFWRIDENAYIDEKVFSRWKCFAFDGGAFVVF